MRQPIDRVYAKFRLPEALYQRLLAEPERQLRTANDEAVIRLQRSFERDARKAVTPTGAGHAVNSLAIQRPTARLIGAIRRILRSCAA